VNGLAIALVLLASAQSGDTRVGSRLDPATRKVANADTSGSDATLYRFVECAVARREVKVRAAIDARNEAAYQKALDSLSDVQRCAASAYVAEDASVITLTSDRGTMRGFIGEAFVKKEPKRAAGLAPLPLQRTYVRDWYEMTGRARPVDEMATCVADTNPAGIVALLKTRIGSSDEKAAVSALAPSLGQCLATGYKLNTNRLGLRTALAEALYHRAFDPAPAAGAAQ